MVALRAQQDDRVLVFALTGLVPVAGAVKREVADGAVLVEVHHEAFAAVPLLASVLPALLELDQVAGLSGRDPLQADAPGLRVRPPPAGDELVRAVGLD